MDEGIFFKSVGIVYFPQSWKKCEDDSAKSYTIIVRKKSLWHGTHALRVRLPSRVSQNDFLKGTKSTSIKLLCQCVCVSSFPELLGVSKHEWFHAIYKKFYWTFISIQHTINNTSQSFCVFEILYIKI